MNKKIKSIMNIDRETSPKQWLEMQTARRAILAFFEDHPYAAFSHLTLLHAVDENCSRVAINAVLWQLIHEGMLSCRRQDNNRLYRLCGCLQ